MTQKCKRRNHNIKGDHQKPRLSVFRSRTNISGQLIDDAAQKTVVSVTTLTMNREGKTKSELSYEAGKNIGELALKKNIKKIVFDRRSYRFIGRVKAFADGARAAGVDF